MLDLLRTKLTQHRSSSITADLPEAAVLIALTDEPGQPEVVLTVRSQHLSSHRGQVAFPGGKRDTTDHSLLHTALRESEEEVALCPDQVEVVGRLSQLVSINGLKVTPFVGIIPQQLQLRPNLDELDVIFKVPLSFFLRDERLFTDVIPVGGSHRYVPCYQFEGYQIWGLSAMMLVELMNVAFAAGIELSRAPADGAPLRHRKPRPRHYR